LVRPFEAPHRFAADVLVPQVGHVGRQPQLLLGTPPLAPRRDVFRQPAVELLDDLADPLLRDAQRAGDLRLLPPADDDLDEHEPVALAGQAASSPLGKCLRG
jgi:hypothetical protein